jgi:hypothetical protein
VQEENIMSKLFISKLLLVVAIAFVPAVASAFDVDLPVSVTASCFSICVQTQNVKGVSGNVSITNLASGSATMNATVKVQCSGVDVLGATQTVGGVVAAGSTGIFAYSIAFTPVAGCAYTVVTTATSSALSPPTRSTTATTPFTADCIDQPCGITGCTLTQGFWKNHAEDWAVTSLTLGTVTYTQAQLLAILNQPVKGNGLVSLAHQLIAAKLNVANGATCNKVAKLIKDADAIIGGLVVPPIGSGSLTTSSVGALVTGLDDFNNGLLADCPGHCAE